MIVMAWLAAIWLSAKAEVVAKDWRKASERLCECNQGRTPCTCTAQAVAQSTVQHNQL